MGPNDSWYALTYTSKAAAEAVAEDEALRGENAPARSERRPSDAVRTDTPHKSSGRRPSLSTLATATSVATSLTTPKRTETFAADEGDEKPASSKVWTAK